MTVMMNSMLKTKETKLHLR